MKYPVYLDPDDTNVYQLTFVARSVQDPRLVSAEYTLLVSVIRNLFAPSWVATPYNFLISTPVSDNDFVATLRAEDQVIYVCLPTCLHACLSVYLTPCIPHCMPTSLLTLLPPYLNFHYLTTGRRVQNSVIQHKHHWSPLQPHP